MRISTFLALVSLWVAGTPAFGQVPECYRHVDSVDWVVPSLEGVLDGWRGLGFPVEELGVHSLRNVAADGSAVTVQVKLARANLAGFQILWIEPVSANNLYTDFLERRGSGILSLNYRLDSLESLQEEAFRMADQGVDPLEKSTLEAAGSVRTVVYLDTDTEGRVGLALVHYSTPLEALAGKPSIALTPSQYAFIARDLKPISAYWEKLGFGKMEITHGPLGDLVYRGQPGAFDQRLGWQRHSDITYEWIEPLQGPSVYYEALKSHGEGFHHFAFNVEDMDQAIAFFKDHGFAVSQSGSWGEKGKPGSGRFAYIDTDGIGGVTVELLWNFSE